MLRTVTRQLSKTVKSRSLGIRPFYQWELWPRLALVLTGGFLLLFGIFTLLSLQAINDSTDRILQERRVIAQMAAVEIDGLFKRAFYELEKATTFANFDPRASNLAAEIHMLAHAYGRIGTLSLGVAFLDNTGRVRLTEPQDLYKPASDQSYQPHIQRALSTGRRQVSVPFVDPRTEKPAVAVVVPVHSETGHLISLLVGLIDLTGAEIRVPIEKAQQLGRTGHALIVDAEGRIVASEIPRHFLLPGEHLGFYRQMIARHESTVEYVPTNGMENRTHVMAFVPLETVPWGVAVGGDAAETLAPVRRLWTGILLLGALSLMAVLGATLFGARLLVRPVKDLTQAAQRIAGGDLRQPITLDEGGEIGLLAQNLERMRHRLAASFQEIEGWNNELEERVQRRTRELKSLNAALQEKEAVCHQLLARVIGAQEEERRRIARELHDETGQVLASLVINLEAVQRNLPEKAATAQERLTKTRMLAEQTVSDIRRLIADLRPGLLDELGLVAAIRWCAENHLEPMGVDFSLHADELIHNRLPEKLETVLFRLTQEAVSNIARHANAKQVDIYLRHDTKRVYLIIQDDGQGFDPTTIQTAQDGTQGLGLAGMEERASLIGGQMHVRTRLGHGTRIEVVVKVPEEDML